jgi:hypothetical protein
MSYSQVAKPTSKLVQDWWNWVFQANRDTTQPNDVTFLRGDIVGDRRVLGAGIDIGTPRFTIPSYAGTARIQQGKLLLPVYDSHFVQDDPFGDGNPCGTTERCLIAAKNDYANLYEKWATISMDKGQPQDIVGNLDEYYIETPEFTINVPENNFLNREVGFSLRPGPHKGVSVGIFLLLTDIQPGTYTLDFGGRATNYFTRAVYNIHV